MHTEQTQNVIGLLKQIETDHRPSAFACSFRPGRYGPPRLDFKACAKIEVFTLDTGRLPDETHALLDEARE